MVAENNVIRGGHNTCVEGLKYDFRMGTRVLLAGARVVDVAKLSETERADLALGPGEMAFVLSEESLNLPNDLKIDLSLKRKMSHSGVLVAGGFCVDPLYEGRLVFLLYNFSNTRFPLTPGKKIIAGIFYRLEQNEVADFPKPKRIDDFPDEVVALMREYKPFSASEFHEGLSGLRRRIEKMEENVLEREQWRQDFRAALEQQKGLVDKLLLGLETEKVIRQQSYNHIETRQKGVENEITELVKAVTVSKVYWAIVGAVIVAVIGAGIGYLLTR